MNIKVMKEIVNINKFGYEIGKTSQVFSGKTVVIQRVELCYCPIEYNKTLRRILGIFT